MVRTVSSYGFSLVGQKLTARTDFLELTDDRGRALALDSQMCRLSRRNSAVTLDLQALLQQNREGSKVILDLP